MIRWTMAAAGLVLVLAGAALAQGGDAPSYSPDGKLLPPANYRDWVFLSSGFDMAYTENAVQVHVFDNVFVNRAAYDGFRKNGAWPDKTVMVLEIRPASGDNDLTKHGQFQAGEPRGIEVHVKDAAKGGWAFYGVNRDGTPGSMFPKTASCYSCHEQHGQTDTTFTQFYPTLTAPLAGKVAK